MSIESSFSKLNISDESGNTSYIYIDVFKNPNKLPINQIHIERSWRELRKDLPEDFDFLSSSAKDIEQAYFEKKTEVIPALDKRWVPKGIMYNFEPYSVQPREDEKNTFLCKNMLYLDTLDYLLNCNFHQFWCIIFFEPSAAIALRSFLLNPILPYQSRYLDDEYMDVYKAVFNKFLLVYEKLVSFKQSEIEFMPQSFGLSKLLDRKLLNLPIVITLAVLYKDSNFAFVTKVADLYFNSTTDVDFLVKEVETTIDQNLITYLVVYLGSKHNKLGISFKPGTHYSLMRRRFDAMMHTYLLCPTMQRVVHQCIKSMHQRITLEMVGGYVCGFDESAVIVPISLEKRPAVFSLDWVYSVVNYLLAALMTSNALFHFYKPAVEMALNKNFPFRLPFMYVNIYRELYEFLDEREEAQTKSDLFKSVLEIINLGRTEFIELFHTFVSNCLDEALKHMGDGAKQELIVETYLKLLTTALEDEYFICDYNITYNIANQNEMFESCCEIDPTRTEFIVSCVNKLPRHKTLQELSKLKPQTIEAMFKDFAPVVPDEPQVIEPQPGPSGVSKQTAEKETDEQIRSIMDMFPHLGDGFVYQCLEAYNFKTPDVINAILENNLPPHLSEIPFDSIRIPPEPEPEKPVLAYKGKKPQYDDALTLLNDKTDIKEIKNLVLEGIKYNYEHVYDDEYDDRDDDTVAIPVPDTHIGEELQTFNPNRRNRYKESESEEEESEGEAAGGPRSERNRINFCEDPAVLRERREAAFRSKHAARGGGSSSQATSQPKPKADLVGKPKGQGQDKNTLLNRQKKSVNKSSRGNHSRKGGAQFKRNRGMIPS